MQNTEGRKTDAAGGKEGDRRFRFPSPSPSIHPRLARPFRSSSSRLASLIEPANLVKTIHYFTIMMAARRALRRPSCPIAIATGKATDNFGSNKRPRRVAQIAGIESE